MIEFTCPQCRTRYALKRDRAGKRTRCAKCGLCLVVPSTAPPDETILVLPAGRPPASVIVVLVGMLLLGLALIALGVYIVTPAPTRESVERRLRERLPPDHKQLKVESFDSDSGRLQFVVSYRESGHIMETDYDVVRYRASDGAPGGAGWRVQATGQRRVWNNPSTKLVMIRVVFDRHGRVTERGADGAGPDDAPVFERRAREIASVVFDVL